MTPQQQIELLTNKYFPINQRGKELFKIELEYLVALAEREQMIKDRESTLEVLKREK